VAKTTAAIAAVIAAVFKTVVKYPRQHVVGAVVCVAANAAELPEVTSCGCIMRGIIGRRVIIFKFFSF
jgi:hypothetical protein